MADPFNSLSNKLGQFFQSVRGNGDSQHPEPSETGVDNPFNEAIPADEQVWQEENTYFRAITRLNELRDQVRQEVGLAACDLVHLLDRLAYQANFDPVGAVTHGKSADEFFSSDPRFIELETRLSKKIQAANVSEVLELVKDASFYTPTARVVTVIETTYLKMLADGRGK